MNHLYAILSDIHGNFTALEAVEKDAWKMARETEKQLGGKVDLHFVNLGDVVDYGPQPNECMDWVSKNAALHVKGNHDAVVVNFVQEIYRIERAYWPVALWTWKVLEDVYKDEITSWPEERRGWSHLESFTLFHSSLGLGDTFIDSPALAHEQFKRLEALGTPYGLFGHTHHQGYFERDFLQRSSRVLRTLVCPTKKLPRSTDGWQPIKANAWIRLADIKRPAIFNPGSVGQPRHHGLLVGARVPYDDRAAYMLLHSNGTGEGRLQFRRVKYDVDGTVRLLRERVRWLDESHNPKGKDIYRTRGLEEPLLTELQEGLLDVVEKYLVASLKYGQET